MAESSSAGVILPELQQEGEEEEKAMNDAATTEEVRSEEQESPLAATPERSNQPEPTSPEAVQTPSPPEPPTTPEPAVPKRAKSAYMLFCDVHREEVCEQVRARSEGKLAIPEVGRELGQRWAQLEGADKAKYVELATKDKVRYEAAMAEYVERTGHRPEKRKRKADRRKAKAAADEAQQAAEVGSGGAGDEALPVTPPPVRPRVVRHRPLTTLDVDAKVLEEAQRLCLESQFMEFVSCPEVREAGISAKKAASARALMEALQKAEGVVAEARRRMSLEVVDVEDVD
eukprot:TRINITY_DN48054_c0_g1_i1.p1 TRINITY_DN48054_c0_g1~~TRINITY_DN48054_c0_g1_i1.p1  ORF type:complete len:306 (+),score=88.52 TRINITY_DN48054_c0_g1_i1:60-920(+)